MLKNTGNRQEAGSSWLSVGAACWFVVCNRDWGPGMAVRSAKELTVYVKSYGLAMRIFEISKRFPPEERFALTSQIRRSARSVANNLREAWARRMYEAHFVSKLTDCDPENAETDTSLDFARDCGYISPEQHIELTNQCAEVGKMLGSMINTPTPFLLPTKPKSKSPLT